VQSHGTKESCGSVALTEAKLCHVEQSEVQLELTCRAKNDSLALSADVLVVIAAEL
jgi:hypothetical protein